MDTFGRSGLTADRQASALQRRASNPSVSAWVHANAGSGKTHVLIDRLIRLMLVGTEPSRILCLTFTRAAAAEMSARLFERLGSWITASDEKLEGDLAQMGLERVNPKMLQQARRLFTSALETPGGLKIQTIHAFCERLLQLFPVEAGVVPRFSVMDDRMAREALRTARHQVLQKALATPQAELGMALAEVVRHARSDEFDDLLEGILARRASFDLTEMGIERVAQQLRLHLSLSPGEDVSSVMLDLAIELQDYHRLIGCLKTGNENDCGRGGLLAELLSGEANDLRSLRTFYLTADDEPRKLPSIATKAVTGEHAWIGDFITSEQQRLVRGLSKLADLERITATLSLLSLAAAIVQEFEREKRRRGAYDFEDLIVKTQRLLADRPEAAWVLYKLDGGIEHVLLDEAQDTSPAQWEIVRALTAEFFSGSGIRTDSGRTLFAVGDRKQSIYSFQGADPDIFELVHDDFQARIRSAGQTFHDVDFAVSFRSTTSVLQAVDMVFHESRTARRGLDGRSIKQLHHEPNRRNEVGTFELWPLIEPEESIEDQPWEMPVDREPSNSPRRKLASMIAAKIKSWIGSRYLPSRNRTVEPGDILILVRVRNSFFDALIRELRKAGIPVAGADRLKLMENIAVLDLVALARFCLLEEDDYSLACLLKSPLLVKPFSEEQLFEVGSGRGGHSLWRAMQLSSSLHCADAVQQLSAWREEARRTRPYEFFTGVLGSARRRILSRLGSEAKDALDAFLGAALDYEMNHSSSLQAFIQWFSSGDIEIKRNMEQVSAEVRIMTVHGAKGLEAPIVILPDTASVPDGRNESPLMAIATGSGAKLPLWRLPRQFESRGIALAMAAQKDARAYEYRRLLYVAMTRAQDELYVCGYRSRNNPPVDCWHNLVAPAVLPAMRGIGDGSGWRMGADPVFVEEKPKGLEPADVPAWTSTVAKEDELRSWSWPSHLGDLGLLPGQQLPNRRRGVLIHRILQLLPEVPPAKRGDFTRTMARKAGQDESAVAGLLALLERPELVELLGGNGLSEVPIVAELKDLGSTISGRIDRVIVRPSEILLVDYKTDEDWPEMLDFVKPEYLLQMAAYQAAFRDVYPSMPVRCGLLWTSAPQYMELPDALLAKALHHNHVHQP